MLILPGSNALSAFRTQALLSQLQAIDAAITGISGRFYHFVDSIAALSAADATRLDGLLAYGEVFSESSAEGDDFVVIPRFGTISPWASKATDIAHNCGLAQIKRIERGVRYRVQVKSGLLGGARHLSDAGIAAVAALLHDRMTETVLRDATQAAGLFQELHAKPLAFIDLLKGGKVALAAANTELGLALSDDEIDYLVAAFT
ncbi:MAG TPA: phosphoribosylformylglycinamidine synthase, partial [Herbaspirillum sp.]|nr:phosphoribosylformylglycinamidine synthase [Herbaspirillum sp.]